MQLCVFPLQSPPHVRWRITGPGVGRAPTWRRRRRRTCQLAARESEAEAEAAATASKWHVGFRGEGRAMPGQCYRGRQRHDPLQLAPERTERGRHRQPSAGEASKTTPAPLTEPHLIPVCRYVPLLLLGYLSAVYTALQKQCFEWLNMDTMLITTYFSRSESESDVAAPFFFSFSSCCFFCCYHSPAVHWHCAESHTRTGRRLVARPAGRTNPCLEGNALPLN